MSRKKVTAADARMKSFAQDECKRALAAWVMAIRVRFEELHASVQKVYFDSRNEDSLLYGLIDTELLGRVYSAMQDIDGDMPMFALDCEIRDPVEIAQGFKESWGL